MSFSKLHTVVAVVVMAAAGAVAWWVQHRPGGPGEAVAMVAPADGRAGAAAASAASGAGGAGGGGGGGPATVEVGNVQVQRIVDEAQAVGSLRSRQSVVLRPEVSGRISKLPITDGQRVKKGQLLVQLDDTLQAAQLRQAQAQASIARSNLQRSRELQAQNFVSQSAVDQNAANLEVAEAQVALARAQLARMKITAPFSGTLGIRQVNVGDYVKDGADIVAVEDNLSVWVDFRLAESYLARLRAGQVVDVALDALPGAKFQGHVDALDAQVDANGRSLLVRARLDNAKGLMRSGMFARARIQFGVRDNALMVPEEALVPQGNKQFLFKVVEAAGGGKQSQRMEAKIGLRLPGKVEILQGLSEGDSVVTAGHARLARADSVPLRVVDIDKPPGRGAAASAPAGASAPRQASPA